jgi:hypothetical protein
MAVSIPLFDRFANSIYPYTKIGKNIGIKKG